jgi:hypothetical protein
MGRSRYVWWHAPLSVGCITVFNALIAVSQQRCSVTHGALFGHLMLGPFSPRVEIAKRPYAPLPVIAASFAAVIPLAVYAARGALAGLVVGSFCWFVAGWYWSVGAGI